jgi:hypothetical protein
MKDKIIRAIHKAISEKVVSQLKWDDKIGKYVTPEGFSLSIELPIAGIAAEDLGLTLPQIGVDVSINEFFKIISKTTLEESLQSNLLKVIQRAELILDNQ